MASAVSGLDRFARAVLFAWVSNVSMGSRIRSAYGIEDAAAPPQAKLDSERGNSSGVGDLPTALNQLDSESQNRSLMQDLAGILSQVTESQNCTKYPVLCQEPFLCQSVHLPEVLKWFGEGFAADGHANPRSFCAFLGTSFMGPVVSKCVGARDPIGAGLLYYAVDLGENKKGFDWDSSYCFINGMCDMPVTQDTTLEDSDKMCDAMFGRETWATFPAAKAGWRIDLPPFQHPDLKTGQLKHYTTVEQTRNDLISTCAMGNMHCDAMMCKETFCKDPTQILQYGHFLLGDTFGKRAAADAMLRR